jgi:hypothetical protein
MFLNLGFLFFSLLIRKRATRTAHGRCQTCELLLLLLQ